MRPTTLGVPLLALALALAAAPSAEAAGYVSPWTIGPADFQSAFASPGCLFDGDAHGRAFLSAENGSFCCAVAPLELPDGSTLTTVAFWIFDNGANDVAMSLIRKRLDAPTAAEAIAYVETSGTSTSIRLLVDSSLSGATVDNSRYLYFLATESCFNHDAFATRFYSALLFYSE